MQVAGAAVNRPVKIAGMAFQAPTLLPWRTTLENLLLPLEIVEPHRSRIRRHKAEYVARAEALLASVGLAGQGDKFPWQLSGGMQQRTSLCRALIHEPDLLMLDEPFGALDAFDAEELWCDIRDLWIAHQPTVVLVTHDLREAAFLADRICVMSARPGRVLAERVVDIARPRDLEAALRADELSASRCLRQSAELLGQSRLRVSVPAGPGWPAADKPPLHPTQTAPPIRRRSGAPASSPE